MRTKTIFFWVAIPLVTAAFTVGFRSVRERWGNGTPVLECVDTIDLGERDFGEMAVGRFELKNSGRAELRVEQFQTSCSCAGVEQEVQGEFRRVESVHLSPGERVDLVMRVAVGARPGQSQPVQVRFKTNDPARPFGYIAVIVPRVKGTVYTEPYAVIFGALPIQGQARQVIDLYDNGVTGRRIDQVRCTHPDRFTVRLLPLSEEEEPAVHEIAGKLIARLEVSARTERPGKLDGEIEVSVANEARAPARIPVVGRVVGLVETRPDRLVLPRRVGKHFLYTGQILLWHPDGKPIQVEVASVPPGTTARVEAVAEREDQRLLQVECRPAESGGIRSVSEAGVRLRVQCEGKETTFAIPILLVEKPS